MLRRRGLQRLLGILGVLLALGVGGLLALPAIGRQSGASSQPHLAGQQLAPITPAQSPPRLAGCPIFPADNIWNVPVDTLPVDTNSDTYVATIGADVGLHPDFGSGLYEGGPIGIPYVVVPASQPGVSVIFEYDDESDPGPYLIPSGVPIEGGPDSDGDRHVLVLERDNCKLYELFYAFPQDDGSWEAGSGAIVDLKSNALRPDTWTSADAGMAVLPGLVRYDEVVAGEINHALRFTVRESRRAYVWPARHFASKLTGTEYPPMGQRFRLKADFEISEFTPQVQVILRALQKYGMMLADNGSNWFISGAPDERWDNDVLRALGQVQGSDFEAVDVSSLRVSPDSGQARTASTSTARLYLPLVMMNPAFSTPTATNTSTATATSTSTATSTTTPTATSTSTPTATATSTATVSTTATTTATATTTGSPTRTSTATATATTTASPTRTSTATATATTTTGSATTTPTVSVTPTPTRTIVPASIFVDDDNTTGVENGSALRPYRTVQQAINAASGGAAIAVARGTYAQNVLVQNKAVRLYGGYVGGTASSYAAGTAGNFSTRDPAGNPTNLQGDATDSVVTLLEAGASIVDGFRITGGSRSVLRVEFCCYGGGLYISGGAPVISNNVIENNDTRTAGGPAPAELIGGGIYAENANISVLDNLIRNNTSGRGGGIAIAGGTVVIRGNTVQGNVGVSDHGGGIYIAAPSIEISYNLITGNEIGRELGYGWGGGVVIFNTSVARFSYNRITDNVSFSAGSGVFIDDGASAVLEHELIYANACNEQGGVGIYVDGAGAGGPGSTLSLINSTVAGNNCPDSTIGGNAVFVTTDSTATILNSILWGNAGKDVVWDNTSQVTASYTLSEEGIAGTGNFSSNPLFANATGYDFHLRSTGGRWDPAANGGSGGWVVDSQNSPAIDAGNPATPYTAEPPPNGGRVNLGAYGNTSQASKSAE